MFAMPFNWKSLAGTLGQNQDSAKQSRTLPDTLKSQPNADELIGSLTVSPILKQRAISNVALISAAPRLLGRARTRAKSERESLVNFQDALSARAPGDR